MRHSLVKSHQVLAVSLCPLLLLGTLWLQPLEAAELTVSAAISLKEAFTEIATQFKKDHPKDQVLFNFAASGELAQQIEQGAPVDVFASAALKQIQILEKKGLLLSSSQPFAHNRLVVVVPKGATKVTSFEQLAKVKSIGIGNPKTVPVGLYAVVALTKAGIYQALLDEKKFVYAENVRQVLTYVESGNVDAGIVYATDVRTAKKATIGFPVPANNSEPIIYPMAVMKDSKQPDLARAFIAFVLSAQGQTILQSKGFLGAK